MALLLQPNTPIVNAPQYYVNQCDILYLSPTVFAISSGAARDYTNTNDIIIPFNIVNGVPVGGVVVNAATVGANGLDQGALVVNRVYGVYVIGDSRGYMPSAGLLSLNVNSPTTQNIPLLPDGYDMFRRVGWLRTDGTGTFPSFIEYGSANNRIFWFDPELAVNLGGGAAAVPTNVLLPQLPPYDREIFCDIFISGSTATSQANFWSLNSSTAGVGMARFGTGAIGTQIGQITIPVGYDTVSNQCGIQYRILDGGTITLSINGYSDNLEDGLPIVY